MKKTIIYSVFAVLIFISCRKTRTCSCVVSGTTVTTTTPRNGQSAITMTTSSAYFNEQTQPGVTKKDMRRLRNCNSRTTTYTRTYTISVSSGTAPEISDVDEESTTDYNCTIK